MGRSYPAARSWVSFGRVSRQKLLLDIGEFGIVSVFLRKNRPKRTPLDGESGIVPKKTVFVARGVIITAFVKKLNCFRQRQKAVGKTHWNINSVLLLCAKSDTVPLPKFSQPTPAVHA